jgi:hypothetical protein
MKYDIRADYKKEETDYKTFAIAILAIGLIWRYLIQPYIIDNPKLMARLICPFGDVPEG